MPCLEGVVHTPLPWALDTTVLDSLQLDCSSVWPAPLERLVRPAVPERTCRVGDGHGLSVLQSLLHNQLCCVQNRTMSEEESKGVLGALWFVQNCKWRILHTYTQPILSGGFIPGTLLATSDAELISSELRCISRNKRANLYKRPLVSGLHTCHTKP